MKSPSKPHSKPAKGAVPPAADASALAHEIRPGQSVELLKELHILTRDGKLNQDSRRKLKQVYHLYQFIEKLMNELPVREGKAFTLADHGAGDRTAEQPAEPVPVVGTDHDHVRVVIVGCGEDGLGHDLARAVHPCMAYLRRNGDSRLDTGPLLADEVFRARLVGWV